MTSVPSKSIQIVGKTAVPTSVSQTGVISPDWWTIQGVRLGTEVVEGGSDPMTHTSILIAHPVTSVPVMADDLDKNLKAMRSRRVWVQLVEELRKNGKLFTFTGDSLASCVLPVGSNEAEFKVCLSEVSIDVTVMDESYLPRIVTKVGTATLILRPRHTVAGVFPVEERGYLREMTAFLSSRDGYKTLLSSVSGSVLFSKLLGCTPVNVEVNNAVDTTSDSSISNMPHSNTLTYSGYLNFASNLAQARTSAWMAHQSMYTSWFVHEFSDPMLVAKNVFRLFWWPSDGALSVKVSFGVELPPELVDASSDEVVARLHSEAVFWVDDFWRAYSTTSQSV